MSFDPEEEPLATIVDLCQESISDEDKFYLASLHFLMKDAANFKFPLTSGRFQIALVPSRNILHVHATARGSLKTFDHVVSDIDFRTWCGYLARELWDKGVFRLP